MWKVVRAQRGKTRGESVANGMTQREAADVAEHYNAGPDGKVVGSGYATYFARRERADAGTGSVGWRSGTQKGG